MTSTRERRSSTDRRRTAVERSRALSAAIEGKQVEILFQPQFACADERLIGAEALARWNHPQRGMIGIDALFALATSAHDATTLTHHIAAQALAAATHWPDPLRLSINATAADIAAEDFAGTLGTLVRESTFPAERLTLELTEQALVHDIDGSAAQLARLAEEGMRIALDDFGAGFCNFRYLKILPLHYLKLDRSMVEGIATDERDAAVLRAIVAMAGALDIAVVAEGIEDDAQLEKVRDEGCTAFQGFVRARPMGIEAFGKFASQDNEAGVFGRSLAPQRRLETPAASGAPAA